MKEEVWVEISNSDLNSDKTFLIKLIVFVSIFVFLSITNIQVSAKELYFSSPIKKIEIEGLFSMDKSELLNLLQIKEGKVLNKNSLKIGIKRAFLKEIFEDIIVSTNEDFSKIHIKVIEKKIVKKINIIGNNYFSDKFIKKNILFKIGDRLNLMKIKYSINNLVKEMRLRGFPESKIDYSIEPIGTFMCNINIYIQEGDPELIKDIIIEDPTTAISSFIKISKGEPYDQIKLKELERNVKNFFLKEGYINANLKHFFNVNTGTLHIIFTKGKRLDINFIGNENFDKRTLLDEVFYYELIEFNLENLEEMVSRLTLYYHQHGFPSISVVPILEEDKERIILNFYLYEGVRVKIDMIKLLGTSIDIEKVKAILDNKEKKYLDITSVATDRENIIEFYRSLGFLDVEVSEPTINIINDLATIEYLIKEGEKTYISNISFKNNKVFTDFDLRKEITLKPNTPYNEVDVSESRRKIVTLYNKAGFLNAKVLVESTFSNNLADITFLINEEEQIFFGENIIVGNQITKSKVIERELERKEKLPLDYTILFKEKQKIQKLGLFSDIETKLSDYVYDQKRDIIYSLQESNFGALEFGIGYGEYEKYRLFFDLYYKNISGMNRVGNLRTELSSLEQRLILNYTEPWFLGEKISLKSLILMENKRERSLDTKETLYKLRRHTASLGLQKTLEYNFKTDLFYDFSVVKTWDMKPDIILSREDTGTLIISGVRLALIYDSRDNPFEPSEGFLAGASFKVASSIFFSQTDFLKMMFYANKYTKIAEKLVFAFSIKGGIAKGFNKTLEIPIVERFFLGGRTTVRGYAEDTLGPKGADNNPTGGNTFIMGNLEMRFYAGKNLGIVGFLDGGNIWQKTKIFELSNLKFTSGIGIRYQTPAGPLRIDYGHKLNREKGESRGELHFSIGHAF
ncbi:MAG: outer membrane protein assembly factor BamA [Thermodesulfovibrionales bacterium]|nr:outer membrane protein assembly factor BamA [Thermodesulfovibrionales bacterium]